MLLILRMCLFIASFGLAQVMYGLSQSASPQAAPQSDVNWIHLRNKARIEVKRVCEAIGQTATPELIRDREGLASLVVTDLAHRKALVAYLREQKGAGACGDLVRSKLGSFRQAFEKGEKVQSYQEFRPYVLLAVAAGLSEGRDILAELSRSDPDNDWLIALRAYDPDAFSQTLDIVLSRIADSLRKELDLELVDPSLYGKIQQNVFSEKSVRFQNPLLLHAYLSDWMERKDAKRSNKNKSLDLDIKSETWSNLNVLYAVMGIQEKTTASALFTQLIQGDDSAWISSLRTEPVWVQFRLLNLMKQVGGPEVVRELLWLSDNAQNEQLKALAATTLDAIVGTGTLARVPRKRIEPAAEQGVLQGEAIP